LEFDDVVVLDGGWERSAGEDSDAERRLYYVAMTRARRSLALMRFSERHPILDGLGDDGAFLVRRAMEPMIDLSDCRKRYQRLDLSEVDLGYAGRLPHEHPALDSLQRLSAGDRVGLKRDGGRFLIVSDDGHVVGRLARKYRPPEGLRFLEGRVFAIVTRKEGDSADEFRGGLRRASWEVLVPELVFGPDG
jgi:ATP-dependent DNA helicase RecQ